MMGVSLTLLMSDIFLLGQAILAISLFLMIIIVPYVCFHIKVLNKDNVLRIEKTDNLLI